MLGKSACTLRLSEVSYTISYITIILCVQMKRKILVAPDEIFQLTVFLVTSSSQQDHGIMKTYFHSDMHVNNSYWN